MYYIRDMCCLCLKSNGPFINLFVINEDGFTYFDKISSFLTDITNIIDDDYLVCKSCYGVIDMMYQFSKIISKNIETYTSYKSILKEQLEKIRSCLSVKLYKIKEETLADDNIDICDNISRNEEYSNSDDLIIKTEVLDENSMLYEYSSYMSDPIHSKMEINYEKNILIDNNYSVDGMDLIKYPEEDLNLEGKVLDHLSSENIIEEENNDEKIKEEQLLTICGEDLVVNYDYGETVIENQSSVNKDESKCKVCGKDFNFRSLLNIHLRVHYGDRPYKCNICKKRFKQKSNIDNHKRIHTGEKPFECDLCKKRFKQKTNLINHKRIHTSEKPYECNECHKNFTQLSHLNCHKLVHTGYKPFSCDQCGKSFRQITNLNYHKLKSCTPNKR